MKAKELMVREVRSCLADDVADTLGVICERGPSSSATTNSQAKRAYGLVGAGA